MPEPGKKGANPFFLFALVYICLHLWKFICAKEEYMKEKKKKEIDFTTGPLMGKLVRFMLPVLLALFLQALYGAVDLAIIGKFTQTASVSGVSMGSQVTTGITNIVAGFATGITVLLGQYIGQGKKKNAGEVIGNSIIFFAALAIFITVLMIVLAVPLLNLFNIPQEALSQGTIYLRICSGGFIFIVAYNLIGGIFRGIGDSTTPLITVACACVINIIGDFILIAGCGMAAAGAAIATVFAQAASVLISLLLMKKGGLPFEFSKASFKINWKLIGRMIKLGLPLGIQEIFITASFLILSAVINTLGLVASAGIGVGGKVMTFILLVPTAFMQSLAAIVSQNVGALKIKRAKKALVNGILLSLAISVVIFYFGFFHGTVFTQIFTNDPEVVQAAAEFVKDYAIDSMLTSFLFCFVGYFNGCGKTTITLAQGIVGVMIRIPTAIIIRNSSIASIFTIGLATPISTSVQIIVCLTFFFATNKKVTAMYSEVEIAQDTV